MTRPVTGSLHGHEKDALYNNVVLHVVGKADTQAVTQDQVEPPQMELEVPEPVRQNYEALLKTDSYPPCYKIIPSLSRTMKHAWMSALETERLERKTEDIKRRAARCRGSWEAAYFVTMARNYGFGINAETMEQWALSIPLNDVAHHSDSIFQIEALFMGQAGLLNPLSVPERHRTAALADEYLFKLNNEYQYLAHKYSLCSPSTSISGASSACGRRISRISASRSLPTFIIIARPVSRSSSTARISKAPRRYS